MHPILHEILFTPMGWLLIAVVIATAFITGYLHWYIAKKMREGCGGAGRRLTAAAGGGFSRVGCAHRPAAGCGR